MCQLKKSDCGPQETLDPDQCICVIDQPQSSTPKPAQSHHTCSLQCRGTNQYLDHRACKCRCRRYLIKQATDNFNYRRGRSPSHKIDFEEELEDELQLRRSPSNWEFNSFHRFNSDWRSSSRPTNSKSKFDFSRSGRRGHVAAGVGLPLQSTEVYVQSCPDGRRVDHQTCVCHW